MLRRAGQVVADIRPRTGGSDGAPLTTAYTLDGQRRVVSVTEDSGSSGAGHQNLVTGYGYDPAGNRLTVTDGRGNTTTSTVDALGRVTRVTDAMGFAQQ